MTGRRLIGSRRFCHPHTPTHAQNKHDFIASCSIFVVQPRHPCQSVKVSEFRLMMFKLRRLLRSRGRSVDDTDDLIQEAFLRLQLYCREHDVKEPEAFLVRTALNLSTDWRKRDHTAARTSAALQRLQILESYPPADEVCASQERLLHMKAGIERLSPRRREVFLLSRIDGYSFSQIAQQLGITVSSVEKHAAKAALELTDWMKEGIEPSKGVKE
jgi:RNA polymerase sigma factor (sigma-70 family)